MRDAFSFSTLAHAKSDGANKKCQRKRERPPPSDAVELKLWKSSCAKISQFGQLQKNAMLLSNHTFNGCGVGNCGN
jgi:hypothetical protein